MRTASFTNFAMNYGIGKTHEVGILWQNTEPARLTGVGEKE